MRNAKSSRQQKILGELNRAPSLRVAELARRLSVSTETIRRDLVEMTGHGELNRTYGEAIRSAAEEPALIPDISAPGSALSRSCTAGVRP